jgi:hypothetical protein
MGSVCQADGPAKLFFLGQSVHNKPLLGVEMRAGRIRRLGAPHPWNRARVTRTPNAKGPFMLRDPLYRQIIQRLNGPLDDKLFERCVQQLLPEVQPGLAPVVGGNDGGMDGAVGDGEGTAFPLVCTTAEDVTRNLRDNLDTYLKKKLGRRKAVLATSRPVHGTLRTRLETTAAERGVTLVNIHDQEAMAALLYKSRRWCIELLNLPGDPPPLSAFAENSRPSLTKALIGRDDDLAWLRNTQGDLVLEGQPGSGKTFLLSALAKAGEALFVVTDDLTLIVGAVREQRPPILLVDDAHLHCSLLTKLRQVRTDTGAEFRIIADCWPTERDEVVRALGAGTPVRTLKRLKQVQILEIVKACGIEGPTWLLRELVQQSVGLPGLAVTLCHLCLRKGISQIAHADALYHDVRGNLSRLAGDEAVLVLAACAVGGEWGMPIKEVGRHLGLPLATVSLIATRLAVGGVIETRRDGVLAVRPGALRHALVRETFFGAHRTMPIDGLLASAPVAESAARTLIGARGRNGQVPFELLTRVMDWCSSTETWREFASLGEAESRWALERHPGQMTDIAFEALHHTAEEILPLLLATAKDYTGTEDLPSALQVIDDWVKAAFPGTQGFLGRRQAVHRATLDWLDGGGSVPVALAAVRIALAPDFSFHEPHPAAPYGLTIYHDCGMPEELAALTALWPPFLERLRRVHVENWQPIQRLVRDWAYPDVIPMSHLTPEERNQVRAFGSRLLRDLIPLVRGRLGILRWAVQTASHLGLALDVGPDVDFLTLFPILEATRDWQTEQNQQTEEGRRLAARWAEESPSTVAQRLAHFQREAEATEGGSRGGMPAFVCYEIAERVATPGVWVDAFCDADLGADVVEPFLSRTVNTAEEGWHERLTRCLKGAQTQGVAARVVLQLAEPPADLLDCVIECLPAHPGVVDSLCFQSRLSEDRMRLLLRHSDPEIASRAAIGEWHSVPVSKVRPAIYADWRAAVVRCVKYASEQMLRSDSLLARDWLEARIRESRRWTDDGRSVQDSLKVITTAQRVDLLKAVPESFGGDEAVTLLVGDDLTVYAALLADQRLRRHHLVPLRGRPQGTWRDKAALALGAGYSPTQVARAISGGSWMYSGEESALWQGRADDFARLESDFDPRIVRVGRLGREWMEERAQAARVTEQREEAYGVD